MKQKPSLLMLSMSWALIIALLMTAVSFMHNFQGELSDPLTGSIRWGDVGFLFLAWFVAAETGLLGISARLDALLHRPSLQRMVALTLSAAALVIASGLWGIAWRVSVPLTPLDPVSLVAALCLAVGAVGTLLMHRKRWTALVLLSVVGLIVSLAFVKFSAPDLALTQLLVEVVTIVLLLLALIFLPAKTPNESSWLRRIGDLGLAAITGLLTAGLTWAILIRPYDKISDWFVDNSIPGGGGSNVVNVILVDFRGFDTLGEITVLAIAAIGIYMLLGGLRLPLPDRDSHDRPWCWDTHPLILATFSRLLLPLALLVAVFILLRGHNLPGGGFIAGLIAAVALILQYLANGIAWTKPRVSGQMHPLIGLGFVGGHRHRSRQRLLWLSVPDLGPWPSASAMDWRSGIGFGDDLRCRRIDGRARHHAGHPDPAWRADPRRAPGHQTGRPALMEALIASTIGLLSACGVYLLLRARTFPVVLGLTLLSYAVNLFLFAMGRLSIGIPAIIEPGRTQMADPLPQALVLTAIVIGFGMTAFVVVLALRARVDLGNDHVDGRDA